MEIKVTKLDGGEAGSVTLSDAIFGLEPRTDIIHRCVVWQLAKRQRGTHAVKNRADIHRTGKKMYRQKGTGSARHGSARVNLFRGGGRSFGPQVRSHEIGLPKKVRALALKHALSAKAKDDGIVIIDALSVKGGKTKELRTSFAKLGLANALFIDGAEINRTGKKMYRQKGTGSARHGSARVNLFRGGGRSFGPHTRSHEIGLPKKVRALALKHALSAKAKDDGIIIIDALSLKESKTKALRSQFAKLGLSNALIIDGAEVAADVRMAARNLPNIDVLPVAGINVYDVLRRQKLVLTLAAVDALEARFK